LLAAAGGCKDTRTAGKTIYEPKTETISLYDVELGPQAPPQDVVYVFLRVARDKRQAVRDDDKEARKKLNKALVSLAAPDRITARYKKFLTESQLKSVEANVRINEVARLWGPVVAHYTQCFPTDRRAAIKQMRLIRRSETEVDVDFPVREETYHSSAILRVSMAREKGYWRIWKVGYMGPGAVKRSADSATKVPAVSTRPASKPVSKPALKPAPTRPTTRSGMRPGTHAPKP